MKKLRLEFVRRSLGTEVFFSEKLEQIDLNSDMLIVDSTVDSIYGSRLKCKGRTLCVPGGEVCKTPETLHTLWQEMSSAGLGRDSTIAVAGGGTVCDVSSFAASTWKRGINLVLVPTTLLCMVDASLGGKTAVNIKREKNQAGTFYPASGIHICSEFLETLPENEMKNGIAEALKTAVIGDRGIVHHLMKGNYTEVVEACIRVKGEIVTEDLEETGSRKLLNLGHTAGHCIEAASEFSIPHGMAVAMGIPVAARMGGFASFAEEFSETALKLGISTAIPESISASDAYSHLSADKKTSASGRTWIIPRDWESCLQLVLKEDEERELLAGSWR